MGQRHVMPYDRQCVHGYDDDRRYACPGRGRDEVIVFGKEVPITELAKTINTIPYEILTGIGDRRQACIFHKE